MRTAAGRLLLATLDAGSFNTGDADVTYGPQPDAPPSSPHAGDHEFTTTSLVNWAVIDSGASQTYNANTTVADCLYIQSAGNGVAHTAGIYKTLVNLSVTVPFTVTAKIAGYANPMGAGVFTDVGLMLGEATPGSFMHGWLDMAEDNYFCIVGSKWTSPTVWSANIGSFLSGGSGSGSRSRTPGFVLMRPHWTRFVVNSSTNVDGYFSFDGLLYTKWLSAYNPGFTIGSVGIDMHVGTPPTEVDCAVAVDYIRFT